MARLCTRDTEFPRPVSIAASPLCRLYPVPSVLQPVRGKRSYHARDQKGGKGNAQRDPARASDYGNLLEIGAVPETKGGVVPRCGQIPAGKLVIHVKDHPQPAVFREELLQPGNEHLFVIGIGQATGCPDANNVTVALQA